MQPVVTPEEMAEADRRTIATGTSVEVLMDRAGRAVAWQARALLGGTYGRRVVIVCGRGNNGGDGKIAARVLAGWGARVSVFELPGRDGTGPGTAGPGTGALDRAALDRALGRADLLVDAMYGTGFRGALEGDAAHVAEWSASRPTLAVDIPSGVDGLTGAAAGPAVRATTTVTFAARKRGLCFEPGRTLAGAVTVADLGIAVGSPGLDAGDGGVAGPVESADVAGWLRAATLPVDQLANDHKWRSALLVVGGSGGMTGAPSMVSHAAMHAGAGMVWCAVPGVTAAAAASGTEVIAHALPATELGALAGIDDALRGRLGRFRAAVVGPGLGTATATGAVVHELVASIDAALVLDADGLNAFAGQAATLRARPAPTVLTPHAAEYERLLGEPVGDDRVAAARRLADATGCVALVKGPGTVVAEPGSSRVVINPIDGPWLATAGTGDVLSGIIGGLLARGLAPFAAAAAGAFLHGRAADLAGHTGLIAGDLVTTLGPAIAVTLDQEP